MKRKQIKDLAKSVGSRLKNRADDNGVSYAVLFRYYIIERFLYRLSCSKYSDNFILKGAMLFRVWKSAPYRTTADADLLGLNINNGIENIERTIREIVSTVVPEDGLTFDADGIKGKIIIHQAKYNGIRVIIPVDLGTRSKKPFTFHIDVGFGDSTFPEPEKLVLETILETDNKPVILCYCKENAIAEKMEAIIWHGKLNSRLKDFADVYFLLEEYSFSGAKLTEAVSRTFKTRNTIIDPNLSQLREEDFLKTKSAEWFRFCERNLQTENFPESFSEVIARIIDFIQPIFTAINTGSSFVKEWDKKNGWHYSTNETD